MGIFASGRSDGGGRTRGSGDIRPPPQEHHCSLYCYPSDTSAITYDGTKERRPVTWVIRLLWERGVLDLDLSEDRMVEGGIDAGMEAGVEMEAEERRGEVE